MWSLPTQIYCVREMDNKELSVLPAKMGAGPDRLERVVQPYRGEDANRCLDYLEQPAEVL